MSAIRLLQAERKEEIQHLHRQFMSGGKMCIRDRRKAEIDGLFAKMYEDWSAGRITEYNFNMLSEKYQNEQKELETKIRDVYKRQDLLSRCFSS